ncbi:MAG: FaeA/PapI family transcriptional regulator [Thermoproteota archaeon]
MVQNPFFVVLSVVLKPLFVVQSIAEYQQGFSVTCISTSRTSTSRLEGTKGEKVSTRETKTEKFYAIFMQEKRSKVGKYNREKFTVITIDRSLKDELHNAKKDDESYSEYLKGHLELKSVEEIELQELPKRQAKKLILAYVKDHHGAYNRDVVEALKIVPWQVHDILHELEKEGKIHRLDKQQQQEDIF